MSMSNLKCGVIGTGYLGKFHAEKYASIPDCELVAVADIDEGVCRKVAAEYAAEPVSDYRQLLGKLDAVSIVTPTVTHYAVARDFLESGAHILLEKPMTVSLDEADRLIEIAERTQRLLQIGHIERFNPALLSLDELPLDPLFVESTRLMPLDQRNKDVCVILDLMIHDLDIILNLVPSEIADIRANGARVLSSDLDIATTRIEFVNGCIANVTASRISRKRERKLRLFKKDVYCSIDMYRNCSTVCRRGEGLNIECDDFGSSEADALRSEIEHFLGCVREGRQPLVGGREGRRALDAAIRIAAALQH